MRMSFHLSCFLTWSSHLLHYCETFLVPCLWGSRLHFPWSTLIGICRRHQHNFYSCLLATWWPCESTLLPSCRPFQRVWGRPVAGCWLPVWCSLLSQSPCWPEDPWPLRSPPSAWCTARGQIKKRGEWGHIGKESHFNAEMCVEWLISHNTNPYTEYFGYLYWKHSSYWQGLLHWGTQFLFS